MRVAPLLLAAAALAVGPQRPAQADGAADVRTARRVILEIMGEGRSTGVGEIFAPGFVAHGASANFTLEQDVAATLSWRTAIPDLRVSVERSVSGGGMVALHWRASGINSVALGELPGKGDRLGIEGMSMFRFRDGRIAEEWSVVDVATLRKQLAE